MFKEILAGGGEHSSGLLFGRSELDRQFWRSIIFHSGTSPDAFRPDSFEYTASHHFFLNRDGGKILSIYGHGTSEVGIPRITLGAALDLGAKAIENVSELRMLEGTGPADLLTGYGWYWVKNTDPTTPWFNDDAGNGYELVRQGGVSQLFLKESAAAIADVAGKGQFWVKNTTPCYPWFTDDAGGDHQIFLASGAVALTGAVDLGGFDLNNGGVVFLTEQAAAEADVAGKGQFWVKTQTPNVPMFTDDAGNDVQLAGVEVGTFTPYVSDDTGSSSEGQTYSDQSGVYRKIGDVVFFWLDLTITSLGSLTTTQTAYIRGFPYTSADYSGTGDDYACVVGRGQSLNITAGQTISFLLSGGANYGWLVRWDSATGDTNMTLAELSAGARVVISGSYIAA